MDAWDTERPGSKAVVVGCVISKDPACAGNRGVIHFGFERGRRTGTLRLVNDTVENPFSTPLVVLGGIETRAEAIDCLFRAPSIGPVTVRFQGGSPAFRWVGGGKWERTTVRFVGAG